MNKKFRLIWVALLLSIKALYGQTFEVKQESYIVRSDHGYWAKQVTSLSSLPEKIQRTLRVILTEKLGKPLYDKLSFVDGQVVDLENHFASSLPSGRIIPKYDLLFVLSDTTLGIQVYYLNVDLDTYGQVLSINWPSKGVEKYEFASIIELQDFAFQYGKKHKLNTKSMCVDLEYEKATDSLYWRITYKESYKDKWGYGDIYIQLKLDSLKLIGEYRTSNMTYH